MTAINDFSQFAALRADARSDRDGALREVAEQFEALFVQNMLKSMRQASFGDPIFGEAGGLFRDMFDQQIATDIASGPGLGLADLLVRQMQPTASAADTQAGPRALSSKRVSSPVTAAPVHSGGTSTDTESNTVWQDAESFIEDILPYAKRAASALGVSPLAILSQAALESGWGQHVMPAGQGSSLNLFGIKASGDWDGERVMRNTIEFRDGIARREREPFRVYGGLGDAFGDYANFVADSERYSDAVNRRDDVAGFASALQRGGYATDPRYADKIVGVAGGETMRQILTRLKETDLLSLAERIGSALR